MIVAGIGCSKGVSAAQVIAAVDAALGAYGLKKTDLSALATAAMKRDEQGIVQAGQSLGLEIVIVDEDVLRAAGARTLSRSQASLEASGLPSLSEAAALAAAGEGASLLGPRVAVGRVTCALARDGEKA